MLASDPQVVGLCPSAAQPWRAGELDGSAPGTDLAWLLESGVSDGACDDALVAAVLGFQRMASWAAAGAARAAAVLADRPSMNPAWPAGAGRVSEPNVAGEELAMALGCSRMAARALLREGRAFAGDLAATGDALARGEIDVRRARVLVRALADLPVPLALDVQDEVLPAAEGRTAAQLERDVARALIVADPGGAHLRESVAARGRRVEAPRRLPDGMAGVWAVLPAAEAWRFDGSIDALARAARQHGDPRTLDQLRADVLVELATGSVGWRASGVTEGGSAVGAAARLPGGRFGAPQPRRAQIRVTVPLSSLLGVDDAPGELDGYGAVTAETARALARGGVWRRIVTDPMSGAVLDVGRTRYRPPEDLAVHVRARDRWCARPGCGAPATSCDLDHTVEYGRDVGETSAENLGPLCPRDHAVKTDGGFRLAQVQAGVFDWTTPTGRRYRVVPGRDGPVKRLPRDTGGREGEPPPF